MKRLPSIAVCLLVASACAEVELHAGPYRPKYFGYWGGSPLQETASYSNVAWRLAEDPSPTSDPCLAGERIGSATHGWLTSLTDQVASDPGYRDLKAVINVQPLFIGSDYRLRKYAACDHREIWSQFASAIRPQLSRVVAIYLPDEPYLSSARKGVSNARMAEELQEMTNAIRGTQGFEQLPVMLNFAPQEVRRLAGDARIPVGVSWIGVDIYRDFKDFGDDTFRQTRRRILQLRRYVGPDQWFFLIPDAFHWNKDPKGVEAVERRIDQWITYVSSDPKVIGVFPFYWWDHPPGNPEWRGAEHLPSVRDKWAAFGHAVTGK